MPEERKQPVSRRSLLKMIGTVAGSTAMYGAMTELGLAQESGYTGPPRLGATRPGTSVLILGAGIAGMVAALELRDAGYKVQLLEYNDRPGGRNWTLYGGDTYTELGSSPQHIQFDRGQYFNPGPWRIPYHHYGILHYANRLKIALEPLNLLNFNAYLHHTDAFGGKPRRYREVQADFHGHVAELLSKCTQQKALDQAVSSEDQEMLLEALRAWGALDSNHRYVKGPISSERRGPAIDGGGGLASPPVYSEPDPLRPLLQAKLWRTIGWGQDYEYQTPLFQAKGGMGQIGKAFGAALENLIQYNSKVIDIHQDATTVTATYVDSRKGGAPRKMTADWCVCTIPASILSQIPMNVGNKMRAAINQLPYTANLKTGLQFKRRFWEEDDKIYGGVSYTNQPNAMIIYPMSEYFSQGKGVLVGAYVRGETALVAAAKTPDERIEHALAYGSKIHPQYRREFDCGASVAWHRVPWVLGCSAQWSEDGREQHYNNLCALDGRIVLAGEHASRLGTWQEGAVTSATDAITRLHKRVMSA
ncbi:MAG: flavin monoamine oxidase family protein [Pseudomonadota bacterium]